jgi:hypothetical protein
VDWRLLRYLQTRDVTYDMPEATGLAEAAEDAGPAPVAPKKGLTLWQEYQRDQIAPQFRIGLQHGIMERRYRGP